MKVAHIPDCIAAVSKNLRTQIGAKSEVTVLGPTKSKGPAIFNSGYPGGANMVGVRKIFDDF